MKISMSKGRLLAVLALLLGCALAEATAIYGFLIAILLIFMN